MYDYLIQFSGVKTIYNILIKQLTNIKTDFILKYIFNLFIVDFSNTLILILKLFYDIAFE